MPLFSEKEDRIFGDILFDIVENTNITRTSPGSKARAIAQALSKKLGKMWIQFDLNVAQSFLSGAEGRYLDYIGNMMGVERIGANTAKVSATDKVLRFYTDIGTFGDINSGSSITVPAGSVISTEPNQAGVRYHLPYAVILPSGESEFYVTAESMLAGSSYNVGAKTLTNHNVTTYSDVLNETLKVTNMTEITSARGTEGDPNYRFRIAGQTLAAERANETSIRLAALVVPGIADVILVPYARGIGTYELLLKAVTPKVPNGLVESVQEAIQKVTAFGIVPTVRKPREVGVSLVGTLIFKKKLPTEEEQSILAAVTENVINYVNNLDVGEELIVNEIIERVLSTSDQIKNIGRTGQPLDNLYIYRPSKLEDNKVRETLLSDYTPASDEKLYVEDLFAGTTPILFRAAS